MQIREESTAAPFDTRVATLVEALQQWLGDRGRPSLSMESSKKSSFESLEKFKKSGLESVQQWALQQQWLSDHQWQWSPYGHDQEGKAEASKGGKDVQSPQASGLSLSKVLEEPGAMEVLAHIVLNGDSDMTISNESQAAALEVFLRRTYGTQYTLLPSAPSKDDVFLWRRLHPDPKIMASVGLQEEEVGIGGGKGLGLGAGGEGMLTGSWAFKVCHVVPFCPLSHLLIASFTSLRSPLLHRYDYKSGS